jgi:hypothetical protein
MRVKIQMANYNKIPFREKRAYYEARSEVLKGALRKVTRLPAMRLACKAIYMSYHSLLGGTHFVAR